MPNEHIDAVREHVNRFVWGTIQLQLTTGMRPGEERLMHLRDIEMSGEVWEYRPQEHKTKHHGRQRLIFIGPKGQQIVKQFLVADRETASKDRRRINCRLSGVEHVFKVHRQKKCASSARARLECFVINLLFFVIHREAV